jgi:tRNA pseudouridine55 synthase
MLLKPSDINKKKDFKFGEILYFNKPLHWTSFDLVNKVRCLITRKIGEKIKVGHAGTLDPLATGVMILATGKATKQIEQLQSGVKEYIATLKLGETTPSFDLEHPVDKTFETEHITWKLIEKKLAQFRGEIWQIPPAYSAIKINGKRAFDYARKGNEVELQPKLLVIDELEILNFAMPYLKIRIVCSKGTYIRALARDIGEALNSGAHLTELQRTRIDRVTLEDCMEIEDFQLI